ncbi:aspartate/glutamate racemase family protein [Mycolicibacterium brisbanense]|uniref:Hydantoin racemase n=1 Tax=Mycolicibacterium brisbanense TaxID=146020 RepID=A0A100W4P7_9MYCO|nr:aspartate/glutamate racemase family protein [Mycolicibacterium brisbanense]MCV7161160.1 aspartate/glutamate racemase family protein [Mycolicibacterium brisbanense]GAS91588.1 hydantoin racemase [Mycolicibacterium brisbanense]
MQKLGIVHTVSQLAPTFADLAAELLPGVQTTVVADELLLKRTIRDGEVDDVTRERLRGHVAALADFGVDAVLVTCSSVGAVVDEIASETDIPVHRVDRAMAERAVALGARVGVLATLTTTLAPTTELVAAAARDAGRAITVVSRLCDGAFAALGRGDGARHDAIVAEELDRLAAEVDVVVLAQASMARVAAARPGGGTPVLSSPRPAMERLAECAYTER